jgi:hypothetical protein
MALFAAWHVEAFARVKRLPDLARVLARGKAEPQALDAKIRHVMSQFKRATA